MKDGTFNLGVGRNRTVVFAQVSGDTVSITPSGRADCKVTLYPDQLAALKQILDD